MYADKPVPFNELVLRISDAVDRNTVPKPLKIRDSYRKQKLTETKEKSPDIKEKRSHDRKSKKNRGKDDEESCDQNSVELNGEDVPSEALSNVNLNTSPSQVSMGEEKEDMPKQLL